MMSVLRATTGLLVLASISLLAGGCTSSSTNPPSEATGGAAGSSGSAGLGGLDASLGGNAGTPSGGAAGTDAGTDAATKICDLAAAFQTEDELEELNSGASPGDFQARLSPDELKVFFVAGSGTGTAIFTASRTSRDVPFTKPATKLNGVNGDGAADKAPTITGNLLKLYFVATGGGYERIFLASRQTTGTAFATLGEVPALNKPYPALTGMPYVLPPGDVIYVASTRASTSAVPDKLDIYRAQQTGTNWEAPLLVTNINDMTLMDTAPVVDATESVMYFARGKAGGDIDIYVTYRISGEFGTPLKVPAPTDVLNTTQAEFTSFISPDGCRLYFYRTWNAVSRIFVATRTPK